MHSRWAVLHLILLLFIDVLCELRTDQKFWVDLAENELKEALEVKWNTGVAKNVILFIGDGMGPNTVTATRIFKGSESGYLSFEKFPHIGLIKTYSANKMVPDSACTATALFTGVKVNQETIGVDATVEKSNCDQSLDPKARLKSITSIAQDAGKSTGIVTTMRVTHATPSPMYAYSAHRVWECDTSLPPNSACKDIARQLIEDYPGKNLNVILGGGMQTLVYNLTDTIEDPIDQWSCVRNDGRNLVDEYKIDKENRGLNYSFVTNTQQMKEFNINETDYLLGIFSNGHMKLEHERDKSPEGSPSLSEMVDAAIRVLEKNEKGYFLMVEGGNIDMAHHRGTAKKAISETDAFDEAVKIAMTMTSDKDTLLIVTSDHAHSLNINGYPLRGSNIFGIAQPSDHDGINYTTLSYGTGGPDSFHYYVQYHNGEGQVVRDDPTDTDNYDYEQIAGVTLRETAHGGSDVGIYARGPYSHLFHNVHEQHYVFYAITYAAKIGQYNSSGYLSINYFLIICTTFLIHILFR